jgi:predicted dehydrogenase
MAEVKKIAIIGAGQLGSRHLQSLARVSLHCEVFVVDPNPTSLDVAKDRWKEAGGDVRSAMFLNHIYELPVDLHVGIIATSSAVRRSVVEELLARVSLRYLVLEKFLFPNENDYYVIQALVERKGIATWVNCPRRMYPSYQDLKGKLHAPVVMNVTGSNWGIGCNAIHWVDLFCWTTKENIRELTAKLDDGFIESKRKGYIEFTGSLIIHGDGGSILHITSFKTGTRPITVTIDDPQQHFFISESLQQMTYCSSNENWIPKLTNFVTLRQSDLTQVVIADLLINGKWRLSTYKESMQFHIALLKVFLRQYNNALETPQNFSCPIT